MRKIKAAHIITRLIKGGAQESVLLTTKYLAEAGYDVSLVSGPSSGPEGQISLDEISGKVRLFIVPELIRDINLFKDIAALTKLYRFIKENRFDIVHTHTSKAGILGRLAARLAGTPIVVHTPHGHFFYGHFDFVKTRFFIFLEKIMAVFTDRIITLTDIGKEEHIKFRIGQGDKFAVISDGVEIYKFLDYRVDSEYVRKELGIPSGAPVVGMVARLVAVKGHRHLLDAFKIILKVRPDARLLIVGDGILKGDLKKYCEEIGIETSVIFTGLRYDIQRMISVFDMAVLPSLNEGLGIALLEAMAMKKPVVASRSGGMPEIVRDGIEGYLVPPADPVSLAERILKIIANPSIARTMGENGFNKILTRFSIDMKIEELKLLYSDLLEKKFVVRTGKIKVLHIITRLIVGGAQENTLLTASGLDKDRYWVMLTSGPASGPEGSMEPVVEEKGIRFIKIPELVREINPVKDITAFIKLYRLIRQGRFDIVHTHTSKAGVLGRLAARLAGCPVIIHTPHGHLFYGHYGKIKTGFFIWLERSIAGITSRIITLTETGRREHVNFGIADPKKFRVVQSGISVDKFFKIEQEEMASLKRDLGIGPREKIVGNVARLVPIKGHLYLIEAARKVVERMPQTKFMIVGDGALRPRLEALVRKRGLSNNFYFLGLRDDIPQLLALFDVFVLSSLNEGMGRVVVEAMASAKPVVATRVGGIQDVVIDKKTGILVNSRDEDALADGIIYLLCDEERAGAMGQRGRARVRELFSKDDMVRRIDELYAECLIKTDKR